MGQGSSFSQGNASCQAKAQHGDRERFQVEPQLFGWSLVSPFLWARQTVLDMLLLVVVFLLTGFRPRDFVPEILV